MRVVLDPVHAAPAVRVMAPEPKKRIKQALRGLAGGGRGLDTKRLDLPPGITPTWRLRVGDWRAVYQIRGELVVVIRIFHRREGYGWLE